MVRTRFFLMVVLATAVSSVIAEEHIIQDGKNVIVLSDEKPAHYDFHIRKMKLFLDHPRSPRSVNNDATSTSNYELSSQNCRYKSANFQPYSLKFYTVTGIEKRLVAQTDNLIQNVTKVECRAVDKPCFEDATKGLQVRPSCQQVEKNIILYVYNLLSEEVESVLIPIPVACTCK